MGVMSGLAGDPPWRGTTRPDKLRGQFRPEYGSVSVPESRLWPVSSRPKALVQATMNRIGFRPRKPDRLRDQRRHCDGIPMEFRYSLYWG